MYQTFNNKIYLPSLRSASVSTILAQDLQDVEEKVEHNETTLNVI